MRNPPRFARVPLAVLIATAPLTLSSLVGPAGADTVDDCEATLTTPSSGGLSYTTDPGIRLAYSGQTVSLSAGWDPAAWESLDLAVACVRLDDNTFDRALSTSQPAPTNGGVFDHSFVIPQVGAGTRLCTRIGLTGDPVGESTAATWISKMHCYEVDHDLEEHVPPDDTSSPTTQPTQPPATTIPTLPTASPASSVAPPGDTPAKDVPAGPEGGGIPTGAPVDNAATPAGGPGEPAAPIALPLLPATGYGTAWLLQQGVASVLIGLGLMVLCGRRPRRHRRQIA